MKTYIVYVNGVERGYIKAANHSAAEKKARKRHEFEVVERIGILGREPEPANVSVAYTEV